MTTDQGDSPNSGLPNPTDLPEMIQNPRMQQDAMTLAQQYRQEGLEKGMEKGRLVSRRQDVLEALEV